MDIGGNVMGDGMDIPLPKSDYELDIVLVGVNHQVTWVRFRTMQSRIRQTRTSQSNCSPEDEEAEIGPNTLVES